MLKTTMTTGALLLGLATAAMGADLVKVEEFQEEEAPAMPIFSWTGFYAGAHAGYAIGRDSGTSKVGNAPQSSFGYNPNGVIGGVHAGYNYAFGTGRTVVIGVEGDIDGADYSRNRYPYGGILAGTNAEISSDIKGSLRGRLGYGVDRMLFYATGGGALANFDTRYMSIPTFGAGAFDAYDRARGGYTLGGGVEYAFMNYLSVRAEYRYTNYGMFNDQLNASAPGVNAAVSHRETDNRLQAGISYKFDSVLPEMARPGN